MNGRVARFDRLDAIEAQSGCELPLHVCDLIWSRRLLPVITLGGSADGPFGKKAPINGAGGLSMTYAVCPSGTGPSLHAHRHTYETFTVMRGRFEFSAGETGDEKVVLEPLDVVSVEPGVYRAFKNVSDEVGVLQVLITGGEHNEKDIYFPASTAKQISDCDPKYLEYFEKRGLRFEEASD